MARLPKALRAALDDLTAENWQAVKQVYQETLSASDVAGDGAGWENYYHQLLKGVLW